MNKKIVAIIFIIFGVLVLFGCTQTDGGANTGTGTGAGTGTSTGTVTGGVNTGGTGTTTGTGSADKVWAANACDYFTLDMVKGVLSKTPVYDTKGAQYVDTSTSCAYIESVDKGKIIAFFMIVAKTFPQSLAESQSSDAINDGGEGVTGVGDKAWFVKKSTVNDKAQLYFVKTESLYAVEANDGVSHEDNKAKAITLAKAVVVKLP